MTGPWQPGPLATAVVELCAEAAQRGDPALAEPTERLAARLREPLRVAVVGRVSSGKSTLVNALLGRRVAPTRATECTKMVTCYRHGPLEKIEVQLVDGSRRTVRLQQDGRLPDDVGVPADQVHQLDVWLPEATLERFTIIDTPGLAGMTGEHSARTHDALAPGDVQRLTDDSTAATGRAEAILFVFATALRGDEVDTIRAFRQMSTQIGHDSPINALGVLTKADLFGSPGEDPWPHAERVAAEFAEQLVTDVSRVVPVSGLLAETVQAGAITERDATVLSELAALEEREVRRLLRTSDSFRTRDVPVSSAVRGSLLDRLSLYGIRLAIDATAGGSATAARLADVLRERSRIAEITGTIDDAFTRRADALKASYGLQQLDRLAWDRTIDAGERSWLGDQVERKKLSSSMHAIAELHALGELAAGRAHLPADVEAEFRRMLEGHDIDHASLGARLARYAFDARPADAHVAGIASRSVQLRRVEEANR